MKSAQFNFATRPTTIKQKDIKSSESCVHPALLGICKILKNQRNVANSLIREICTPLIESFHDVGIQIHTL